MAFLSRGATQTSVSQSTNHNCFLADGKDKGRRYGVRQQWRGRQGRSPTSRRRVFSVFLSVLSHLGEATLSAATLNWRAPLAPPSD
ncbi:hypothetical protein EVAR_36136_1 [Eumeta japonica]|uniref:Uncharacterized protein n=1 Tax=Eumeta variegata TaxID=151549 RepID=A0A4C1X5A4_EUMVA|nr:hypothetical protein EVAR_36136_1 [Eumeta japonica]